MRSSSSPEKLAKTNHSLMLKPFELHEAESLEQASGLLSELGESATTYAGGTELLLAMKGGLLRYDHLVDIKCIEDLSVVQYDPEISALIVGAAATHRQIEFSPVVQEKLPILAEVEHRVANVRVRNQGTIGGNLCFADPHSDPATLFLVLEASLLATGEEGQRSIAMQDFILDMYTTSLKEGEILTAIQIPRLPNRSGTAYEKFGIYERPSLGVAVALLMAEDGSVGEARIAVGCVGPRPSRMSEAEAALKGAGDSQFESRLLEAADLASRAVDPIDDMHGTPEYKRHLVSVLVQRTTLEARRRGLS